MRILAIAAFAACLCSLGVHAGAQDSTAARGVQSRVTGVVFDSVAMHVLGNATVQLVSAKDPTRIRSVVTAPNGSFAFDSVGAGTWLLGFFHPTLDLLGGTGSLTRLDVRTSDAMHVALATPSPTTIVERACHVDVAKDSTGLLVGYVRRARQNVLTEPAHVRVQWSELTVSKEGIIRRTPSVDADASPSGTFAVCGVPLQATVVVRAWAGSDSSGLVELDMPSKPILQRDIAVGAVRRVSLTMPNDSTPGDSAGPAAQVARGEGVLRGVVKRPNGEVVSGARLVFWGSGVETMSNANGVYSMKDLPTGTWTIEARALGYLPVRQAVDIYPDDENVADIAMEKLKVILDTVKVTAQRIYLSPQMRDFEQRRKAGFGYFYDEDQINKRNPIYVADLFRTTPGVMVMWGGGFGQSVVMRSRSLTGGAYCVPAFFIDGMRVTIANGTIDELVNAMDVRAVEVYTRASNVPPQFNTMEGCGSIVIHTGQRRPVPNGDR